MLCPEVWNLKANESSFLLQSYPLHENNHLDTIRRFTYNHLVTVILPATLKVPPSLTEALGNDCDYYKIKNVKLAEFASKDFITNFVNSGSLYLLSVGTRLDCENCVSITPTGKLILSLDRTSYQSLGLEGQVSHFHTANKGRYIVTIDLKQKHFKPGKANYERTKAKLENLHFDVIVTWESPNAAICPSSVAKYFHDLKYDVRLCSVSYKTHSIFESVKIAVPQENNYFEFVEWLGIVALGGDLAGGAPDNYVNTHETPEPCQETGQMKCMQWRGFFTTERIEQLYNELRKLDQCEWKAMYVQGFSDSAVAWQGQEHHFYANGDSSYTFVVTNDKLLICKQSCSRKRYNNKRKGKPL